MGDMADEVESLQEEIEGYIAEGNREAFDTRLGAMSSAYVELNQREQDEIWYQYGGGRDVTISLNYFGWLRNIQRAAEELLGTTEGQTLYSLNDVRAKMIRLKALLETDYGD